MSLLVGLDIKTYVQPRLPLTTGPLGRTFIAQGLLMAHSLALESNRHVDPLRWASFFVLLDFNRALFSR